MSPLQWHGAKVLNLASRPGFEAEKRANQALPFLCWVLDAMMLGTAVCLGPYNCGDCLHLYRGVLCMCKVVAFSTQVCLVQGKLWFVETRCNAWHSRSPPPCKLLEALLLTCNAISACNFNLFFSRIFLLDSRCNAWHSSSPPLTLWEALFASLCCCCISTEEDYVCFKETTISWTPGERPFTALRLGSSCRGTMIALLLCCFQLKPACFKEPFFSVGLLASLFLLSRPFRSSVQQVEGDQSTESYLKVLVSYESTPASSCSIYESYDLVRHKKLDVRQHRTTPIAGTISQQYEQ